ncbi:MAG: hypothetical protein H7141_14280 [Burkholderiales bacterium]|nr:hypothetical protein [Bacteroidia bacterium]
MKTFKTLVLSICIILGTNQAFSQKGHGHGNGGHGNGNHKQGGTKVIVKGNGHHGNRGRSVYRPANIVVFHPHWHPAYSYNRRWVYFPRYNFYWDNWRQGYYYMNGPAWVFKTTPPPVVINVNLEKEKNYELKEDEDDLDDVYKTNDKHKTEFKPD